MKILLGLSVLLVSLFWAPEAGAHSLSHKLYCVNSFKYVYYTEDAAMANKCKYNFDSMCNWKATGLNCRWEEPGSGYKLKEEVKAKAVASVSATATATNTGTAAPAQSGLSFSLSLSLGGGGKPEGEKEEESKEEAKEEAKEEPKSQVAGTEATKASTTTTDSSTNEEEAAKAAAAMQAAKAAAAKAAAKKAELEQAKQEAQAAAAKVEEFKATMEEIRVNNENNALLYRSPDANLGSADPRFDVYSAGVSGGAEDLNSAGLGAGLPGKGGLLGNSAFGKRSGLSGKRPGDGLNGKKGRSLAASAGSESDAGGLAKSGEKSDASGASTKSDGGSATSDNPWVNYMGQTSKTGLIDRLRKNPSLRDALRDRIAELQAQGDQSGVVELMEEALATAEKESQEPNLDDLKPMAISEAFSMDAAETDAQIRSLLADLDTAADPQFLPDESLFERVTFAHRRSLVRGTVKTTR